MARNKNMHKARKNKNNEFYTLLSTVEAELYHYDFKDKIVYCNCDDPTESNFTLYFILHFKRLGIKKLICTCYKNQIIDVFSSNNNDKAVCLEYNGTVNNDGYGDPDGNEIKVISLNDDGDFRNPESIKILKTVDIVATNPPFSLFRPFVDQLMKYKKEFIIIGNKNAITYKEIFKYIKEGKMWLGYNSPKEFLTPEGKITKKLNGLTRWFTNMPVKKRNEELLLFRIYHGNEENYPKYDKHDIIEVGHIVDIPIDYKGVMAVPITFLDKHNPDQFEIIGYHNGGWKDYTLKNKHKYGRIHIKNKNL